MSNYTFRLATKADAQAAHELVTQVLIEYGLPPDHSGTDSDLLNIPESYADLGGEFWVMEDESGAVIGTGGLYPLREGVAEIRKMYFLPEARGKGYGRKMLHMLMERARVLGFKRLELETASVLKEAISLYQSAGFKDTGSLPEVRRCDQVMFLDILM